MQQSMVPMWDNLPPLTWKDKVCLLTHISLQTPQIPAPLEHIFESGNYIREMRLPAGSFLTGREHLLGHEVQLLEGSAILLAPDGRFQFDAYASIMSKPGFHAVCYCITDIIARTVHPNPEDSRDVDALEKKWFGSADEVIVRGREIQNVIDRLIAEQKALAE
jgi:hypothetical protein